MTYEEYPPDHYVQPWSVETERLTYLCDIDGTLTFRSQERDDDLTTRGIHDYDRVSEDWYNDDVFATVSMLQQAGARIIFVSGRPESCREDTERWLNQRGMLRTSDDNPLYMRTTGDRRPDTIVKRELFDKYIRPMAYQIAGVFDDRNRVVRKTWREQLGLTVYHVADHDF